MCSAQPGDKPLVVEGRASLGLHLASLQLCLPKSLGITPPLGLDITQCPQSYFTILLLPFVLSVLISRYGPGLLGLFFVLNR